MNCFLVLFNTEIVATYTKVLSGSSVRNEQFSRHFCFKYWKTPLLQHIGLCLLIKSKLRDIFLFDFDSFKLPNMFVLIFVQHKNMLDWISTELFVSFWTCLHLVLHRGFFDRQQDFSWLAKWWQICRWRGKHQISDSWRSA